MDRVGQGAPVSSAPMDELRERMPMLPWPTSERAAWLVAELARVNAKRHGDVPAGHLQILVHWPRPEEQLRQERRVARERSRFGPAQYYKIDVPRGEFLRAPLPPEAFAVAARLSCGWFAEFARRGDVSIVDVEIKVVWAGDSTAFGDVHVRAAR